MGSNVADDDQSAGTRLDVALVERGLAPSRAKARAAIEAGQVELNGSTCAKAARLVSADDALTYEPAHPWVSRAGVKLAHALDAFAADPAGKHCLDLGASTGGFTEVLLSRGAAHVTAVDVGRDQFHDSLRSHDRITSLEATDVRALEQRLLAQPPDLITADLSFIALEKAIGPALALASRNAQAIILFKPQFQVGRAAIGKGGLVRDAAAIATALETFERWTSEQGWPVQNSIDSPIRGGDGNREFLLHLTRTGTV